MFSKPRRTAHARPGFLPAGPSWPPWQRGVGPPFPPRRPAPCSAGPSNDTALAYRWAIIIAGMVGPNEPAANGCSPNPLLDQGRRTRDAGPRQHGAHALGARHGTRLALCTAHGSGRTDPSPAPSRKTPRQRRPSHAPDPRQACGCSAASPWLPRPTLPRCWPPWASWASAPTACSRCSRRAAPTRAPSRAWIHGHGF